MFLIGLLHIRKEQNRIGRLAGDLAQDVDRFGFQPVEVAAFEVQVRIVSLASFPSGENATA